MLDIAEASLLFRLFLAGGSESCNCSESVFVRFVRLLDGASEGNGWWSGDRSRVETFRFLLLDGGGCWGGGEIGELLEEEWSLAAVERVTLEDMRKWNC